jgi:cell division septation protein DedD
MARDYAKTHKTGSKAPARRQTPKRGREGSAGSARDSRPGSAWRSYFAGLLSGIFLCFLLYLGTMPAADGPEPGPTPEAAASTPVPAEPPKPRFDFYTMLPQQTIDGPVEPAEVTSPPSGSAGESYLLQAGSFRQREDADRRRAELLLLGLEPQVEETNSDNGRWFRVYLGPFSSHSQMTRARSLTAAQDIDTLLLKRGTP